MDRMKGKTHAEALTLQSHSPGNGFSGKDEVYLKPFTDLGNMKRTRAK